MSALLFALLVPLQFEEKIVPSVNFSHAVRNFSRLRFATVSQRRRQRSLISTSQTDQSCRKFLQIIERGCAFSLCCLAHFEARNKLAKILITDLRCAQQQNTRWLGRELM